MWYLKSCETFYTEVGPVKEMNHARADCDLYVTFMCTA